MLERTATKSRYWESTSRKTSFVSFKGGKLVQYLHVLGSVLCIHAPNTNFQLLPYEDESTASRPICKVKHLTAQSVLRWGTTWEYCGVAISFCFACTFFWLGVSTRSRAIYLCWFGSDSTSWGWATWIRMPKKHSFAHCTQRNVPIDRNSSRVPRCIV